MIKIETIIYKNSNGDKVVFNNIRPYILESVSGIGSPGIDSITTKSIGHGSYFHTNYLDERIISINVGIFGNSRRDMFKKRDELISILNPNLDGLLIYKNDYLERQIECKVYSGPNYSSKLRRLQKLTIEFICPDPMFKDLVPENNEMATIIPNFKFPLKIPKQSGIEFGIIESNPIGNIINHGDINTGFIVEFKAKGTVINPRIMNIYTREFISVCIKLEANEILKINTNFNNKKVEYINKDNEVENIFSLIDIDSTFFQLKVGDNHLKYDAEKGIDNLHVNIYYNNNYWGC